MNNPLYKLMLYNIKAHIDEKSPREIELQNGMNTFELTSALAILVGKSKEDVMSDYLNSLKK
jgi:hypothetical protein